MAQKTLAIFFVLLGLSLGKTEAGDFSFDSSALRFSAQSEDISLRKRIGKSLFLPGLGEFSLGETDVVGFLLRAKWDCGFSWQGVSGRLQVITLVLMLMQRDSQMLICLEKMINFM